MLAGIATVALARQSFQPLTVLKQDRAARDLEQTFGLELVK